MFDSDNAEEDSPRPSPNRKRGRPKANGKQPDWMLLRRFVILWAYNESKKAGEKHSVALTEAAAAVRVFFPNMRVPVTEVRRTLAEWQPKNSPLAVVATAISTDELRQAVAFQQALGIPEAATIKRGFRFGLGARPQYPRANARSTEGESGSAIT